MARPYNLPLDHALPTVERYALFTDLRGTADVSRDSSGNQSANHSNNLPLADFFFKTECPPKI
ncbi:hypothetical protein Cabys_2513 [Caldithrix abyssi DSM 13497]|uniref:Uncharacterized protein n=1 Tax=Caldithrix abyssi DSM 13497 TaxID=880073 RepID=A0A1J1C9P4_CALAY|nr:hypothetical protein Cabys_2513 [Caldithrix abyssi DSM 13497]